jgi:predicted Zn-dependent protease
VKLCLFVAIGLSPIVSAPAARAADASTAPGCGPTPYECAVSYIAREDFGAAVRSLEPWLAETPGNLKALNLLGLALTGLGRIDEANARFGEALALDPSFNAARKNLAVNEFNRGRVAAAEPLFQEVLRQAPADEVAHLHLAEIHFQRKDCGAALAHYDKSGPRPFHDPRWTLNYAACLLEQEHEDRALTGLGRLPENDAARRFEAGVALGRAGAHASAATFFRAARLKGYKDAYTAGYNETLMHVEAGDETAAIQVAQELIAQGTVTAELYNLVARAYVQAGRIQEAYDALRMATRLEPSVEAHYVDLALICLDHENYDLGLEIVDVGLHHRPQSPTLRLQRGVLLAMKGRVELAEKEFEAARTLAPQGAVPHVALAMAWMQTGHTPRAVALLRERSRHDPKDPMIFHVLGLALMRGGAAPDDEAGTEATAAFEEAVRLSPDFSGARAEWGKLLLKRGSVDSAIVQLERAVALDPANVAGSYSLAQAYRKAGQVDRASEMLARVSRLNARERQADSAEELRRMMVRLVREGASTAAPAPGRP